MIGKIKEIVRNIYTAKYDDLYRKELDQSWETYHHWITCREKEENPGADSEGAGQGAFQEVCFAEVDRLVNMSFLTELSQREETVVIFCENQRTVSPYAAALIQESFAGDEQLVMAYGDEDELNSEETCRLNPWFKPDYSPDTLFSYFYFGSLLAVRKSSLAGLLADGRFRELLEESPLPHYRLYAIALQLSLSLERNRVKHIRSILSSSHSVHYWGWEKEYDALKEKLWQGRRSCAADHPDSPMELTADGVSIIIPSKDNPRVLERCLASIMAWTKTIPYEVIVVDNGSSEDNRKNIEELKNKFGFNYIYKPMEFNFSAMCNLGAGESKGRFLLFLNDDCEARQSHWLEHLKAQAAILSTGAVGAKLYYPRSKRIQHCGIYSIHLGPVHKLQFKEDVRSYADRRNLGVRNVLAVTAACLMVRREVFAQAQGFDEKLRVAFNDVDFCWRLYELGYNNVVDNEVHLCHHESLTRGSDDSPRKHKRLMAEKQRLASRHPALWNHDPYYHPCFTTDILDTNFSCIYEYPGRTPEVLAPVPLLTLPQKSRMEDCVTAMIEYAGEPEGWFLDSQLEAAGKCLYIQGNSVVLGSDNACYETFLLLKNRKTGAVLEVTPSPLYRPDIPANLPDQRNAALTGFACLVSFTEAQTGTYELAIMKRDRISGMALLKPTGHTLYV